MYLLHSLFHLTLQQPRTRDFTIVTILQARKSRHMITKLPKLTRHIQSKV